MPATETATFLPLVDAAARLRVSYQQAHRMTLLGELEGHREGKRWLVSRVSLNRMLRRQSESPSKAG